MIKLTPQVRNPNTLLNPGDMFTVDPAIIPFINVKETAKKGEAAAAEAEAEDAENDAADEALANSDEGDAEPAAEAKEEGAAAEAAPEAEEAAESEEAAAEAAEVAQAAPGTRFRLPAYAQPFIFVPAYLLPSFLTCSAVYVRHPTARAAYSEIPSPYDAAGPLMSMSWEWYQKVAPRMRPRRRARLLGPERKNDRK